MPADRTPASDRAVARVARFDEVDPAEAAVAPVAEGLFRHLAADAPTPAAPVALVEDMGAGRGVAAKVACPADGTDGSAHPAPVVSLRGPTIGGQPRGGGTRRHTATHPPGKSPHQGGAVGSEPGSAPLDGVTSDRERASGRRPRDGAGQGARARRTSSGLGSHGAPAELAPDADPVAAARDICLRLLAGRAHTRQELAKALRRRGVPDEAACALLGRFDEVGLIDDAAFAGQWVRSRHNHKGLAKRAIAMELRHKGVADEVAGEALAEIDPESEDRRARELVDRKLRTVPAGTPEQRKKAAQRLVGMLARKGYGGGTAYRVVREALAAHGADIEELGPGPMG